MPKLPEYIVEVQRETCPVTGKKVSKDFYAIVNGKAYFFSAEDARERFASNPEKYLIKDDEEEKASKKS